MTEPISNQELQDRLSLIETMIGEGRRTTEHWSWTFVLWGAAYMIAVAWSAWGHGAWAWPLTMLAAAILSAAIASRLSKNQPETALGRAVGAIWIALGISAFLMFVPLSLSGRTHDWRIFISVISAMLGMANASSSFILRWKPQFACAIGWWAAAAGVCFVTPNQALVIFLAAIFLCQIVFGVYGMICEARASSKREIRHG